MRDTGNYTGDRQLTRVPAAVHAEHGAGALRVLVGRVSAVVARRGPAELRQVPELRAGAALELAGGPALPDRIQDVATRLCGFGYKCRPGEGRART